MTFDDWFILLERYAHENGDAVPPKRYVVDGRALGRWARHLLTDRPPTDDQHARLVALPGWRRAEISAVARQLLGRAEPDWQAAAKVLIASLHVGGDVDRIVELTGLDPRAAAAFRDRLVQERLWEVDGKGWTFRYPWLDDILDGRTALGAVGFGLHVAVAVGFAVTSEGPDGELLYSAPPPSDGSGGR